VKEADLTRYAEEKQFPIIPCDLCGSQETLKRREVKAMLNEWDRKHPGRVESLFTSLANITTSHLMDRNLHPFTTLKATGKSDVNGDIAFDEEPCAIPENGEAVIRISRMAPSEDD
jgi:tRNA 2-thiocytidine biosynthesis protein TtcA